MVSSAVEGFITGFSTVMAEDILTRKKEARDYFNKQVEYARTSGLENRRRVQDTVNANLSIARQLEAAGVPREIIMAQVNQNPDGLPSFYEQAEKLRAKAESERGTSLTPEEWKAIYKVSGQLSSPDEDLSTFISRTYDPIASATSTPDFADDPEGSLFATMMGYNAMDRARARLGETEIADGLTAEQLISYGDNTTARPSGTASVTVDYSAIPSEKDKLSIAEVTQVRKAVDERLKSDPDLTGLREGEDATAIRDRVVEQLALDYGSDVSLEELTRMANETLRGMRFVVDTGSPQTSGEPATEPVEDQATSTPETPQPPLETPPTASAEALSPEERMAAETGLGIVEIQDHGDGTSTLTKSDGSKARVRNDDFRMALKRFTAGENVSPQ